MRGWGGWSVGVAVLAAVWGTGCGMEGTRVDGVAVPAPPAVSPAPPTDSTPPSGEVPGHTGPDAGGTPVPASTPKRYPLPDRSWPTPDASTLAADVPACVPLAQPPSGPRYPHPCEVRTLRTDGGLARRERFDVEGHPTEEIFFLPDGHLASRVAHTWVDGLERRRLAISGTDGSTVQEDWVRDEAGRLKWYSAHREPTGSGSLESTFYDARGRIERVETVDASGKWVHRYAYNAAGRLDTVSWEQVPGGVPQVVERYTYHPNGQLHTYVERSPLMFGFNWDKVYDEAGRLLMQRYCHDNGCRTETWVYVDGQLASSSGTQENDSLQTEWNTRYVYDSEGRPAVEARVRNVDDMSGRYQERQVLRRFYACETGALLREELDADADGTPDGLHELQRDAAGNLVTERFSGTAVDPSLHTDARQYDYSCY